MVETALIVGLGNIGMTYDLNLPTEFIMSHSRALSVHPNFKLLGAVDINPSKRKIFSERYGLPVESTAQEISKIVPNPDLVIIATPTTCHFQSLKDILEVLSPKCILCEKPISNDILQAQEMVQMCLKIGIKLYINYMRRSEPSVRSIYSMIKSGDYGSEWHGSIFYSKGFLHNASHFHNLFSHIFGPVVSKRKLFTYKNLKERDKIISAKICYEKGIIYFIPTPISDTSHLFFDILSESHRISYQNGGREVRLTFLKGKHQKKKNMFSIKSKKIQSDFNRFQIHVLNDIQKLFEGKKSFLCSGQEDLNSLIQIRSLLDDKKN